MKKLIMVALLIAPVAACTPTQQGAVIGGAGGAAVGAAVAGNDVEGAVIGGAVGAVAGALVGRSMENRDRCIYRDSYGRQYVDRCPAGY